MIEDGDGASEKWHGYKPTFYKVAIDALAAYVLPAKTVTESLSGKN
jgi:hypothetical protein